MLDRLFRPSEQRSLTWQSLFESGAPMPSSTRAGVSITQDNSFKIGAVYAAVRLISDTISTLPLDTFVRRDGERLPYRPRPAWVDNPEPDPSVQRSDHYQSLLVSLLVDGNAFVRKIFNGAGDVTALTVLDPKRVEVRRSAAGRIEFVIDQGRTVLSEAEMLHITELRKPGQLRGTSRITELRETLGLTKALEDYSAQFFGSGSTSSGIIETPFELTAEQAEGLQAQWEKGHKGLRKAHRPGILSGGAKWVQTSVNPEDSQLLASREFAVEEVCRLFRIPLAMLQSSKPGTTAYASREQDSLQFVTYTLLPYIAKIEGVYGTLLPGDAFLRFNVDGLLRASLTERYAAYSQAIQAGFLSINDIHRLEDMSPADGGDVYRVPLANVNLEAANIVETDKRVLMAVRLVNAGFDPNEALAAFNLPAIAHTGLPSVQLQNAAQQALVNADPETDATTEDVYPAERAIDPSDIADAITGALASMPAPVVNVTVPESAARSKRIERDDEGNITAIIEE